MRTHYPEVHGSTVGQGHQGQTKRHRYCTFSQGVSRDNNNSLDTTLYIWQLSNSFLHPKPPEGPQCPFIFGPAYKAREGRRDQRVVRKGCRSS